MSILSTAMSAPKRTYKRGIKRTFVDCSTKSLAPIPFKKQKAIGYLDEIKNIKQSLSANKLQINQTLTQNAANDPLFNKQPSSKPSQYTRWVIACKFIIASGLKLDSYDVLGMNRHKIPHNMYFYVDDQNNLCAILHNKASNPISNDIISHCNKIETSVVQSYHGTDDTAKYIQYMIDEQQDTDTQQWQHNAANPDEDAIFHVIRISMSYYTNNMQSSFYWLCCRITGYLVNVKHDFGHPLFQLFLRHIANFDCFQRSVPMVPLFGSLYPMFCQFACGVYHPNESKNIALSLKEFTAFLGAYDCWKEMERKRECRSVMRQCWVNATNTNVHIMAVVIEFADIHSMTDERVLDYINQFEWKSTKYKSYVAQLKSQIHDLSSMIIN